MTLYTMEVKVEEVKEILFYLDPLIRSQSGKVEAETLMKSLQELDGGLGQYRLTSTLRQRLREIMMDSIRQEVEVATRGQSLSAETMQELAPGLLRNLTKERQWSEFVCQVRHELGDCSKQVADSLSVDQEKEEEEEEGHSGLTEKMTQLQLAAGSGPESLGSTWQQANFIIVQPEQLRRLASEMVSGETEAVRVEALNTLLLSQVTDLTASQHWTHIKAGYRKCLSDPSQEVSCLSLKFHARLMMSASHFAIKEGFVNLLSTVSGWYSDKRLCPELPVSSLSADCRLHQAALNVTSLALSMAADLPKTWIRFPQRFVEEIIESMIEFLSVKSPSAQYSPLTLVSVVDHEASWLRYWLHSKISRTIFLRKLSSSRHLLRLMQQDIISYIENTPFEHYQQVRQDVQEIREKSEFSSLSGRVIEFGSFLHKINFVLEILSYRSGGEVVEEKERLLASIVQLIVLPSTACHPGKYIADRLKKLVRYDEGLINPFTEILSSRETQSVHVVVNALTIVLEHCRHSPTSEEIFSSLHSVLVRMAEAAPVRSLVTSILRQSATFPVTFTFPSWRRLLTTLTEMEERSELYNELQNSARIFYYNGVRERERDTSQALLCRSTSGAELLLKGKVFKEKLENLSRLIHGEDEDNMKRDSDEVVVELAIQELMMLVCSAQFVVSHSKDRRDLSSVLPPRTSEDSLEWRLAMLRLVLSLATNLDALIAAEHKFRLCQAIETAMKECQQEDGVVVDEEFLYLRYIYNIVTNIGGPLEMRLCSLSLSEDQTGQVRERKCSDRQTVTPQSAALDVFLEDESRVLDLGWIETAAEMFRELTASNKSISTKQTVRFFEKFSMMNNNSAAKSPRIEVIDTTDDSVGLDMIIRYGTNLGLWERTDEAGMKTSLAELIKVSRSMFPVSSYDWFVSAVFLVTGGQMKTTSGLMSSLPPRLVAPLLWHNLADGRQETFQLLTVGFATELIMDSELPALAAFLNINNIPISVLLDIWLRQCFINVLDFEDVKNFLLFTLVFGADYIVYFCVSVLYHIQEDIMEPEEESVNTFQRMITLPIAGFSATEYLPYMDILSRKHRDVVMQYFTSMIQ